LSRGLILHRGEFADPDTGERFAWGWRQLTAADHAVALRRATVGGQLRVSRYRFELLLRALVSFPLPITRSTLDNLRHEVFDLLSDTVVGTDPAAAQREGESYEAWLVRSVRHTVRETRRRIQAGFSRVESASLAPQRRPTARGSQRGRRGRRIVRRGGTRASPRDDEPDPAHGARPERDGFVLAVLLGRRRLPVAAVEVPPPIARIIEAAEAGYAC
jgi:hypothetical protein